MTPLLLSGGEKLVRILRSRGLGGRSDDIFIFLVNQEGLTLFLRSPAGHPAEDWGQRSHSLPGESGARLSSTIQPHHREGAKQDLQHPHWSVCLSVQNLQHLH